MSSKPDREPPKSIAHYRITGVIGRGGMAVVYAATNERTGADVALKVVDDDARSDDTRARFEHEAQIAGKLEHPNIVRVYDFVAEPTGTTVLVMERLRGETLASLLSRRKKLTLEDTLAIVLPILSALDHTHRQGIVHRDVKPSNVFLAKGDDDEVTPKLLDFGIATRPLTSPHLTADDEVLGTPRAMSPEQIRGNGVLDGRSDLFSLASTMLEMLTSIPPFEAKTAAASLVAVLERDVDPPVDVAPRVFVELERALRKRPFERHATAAELASALRDAADVGTDDQLRAARRKLAPVEASLVGTVSDTTSDSPVERRKRPRLARGMIGPTAAAIALVAIAFGLGSRVGARGTDAPSGPAATPLASAPAATAVDPAPVASEPPFFSPTALPPPPSPADAGREAPVAAKAPFKPTPSAPPKASAKPAAPPPKPVATRPDF